MIRQLEPTRPVKRFEIARELEGDYFLAVDDDVFLEPGQVERLFAELKAAPEVPHGVVGQILTGCPVLGDPVLSYETIERGEGEVDFLNRVYLFTRKQCTSFFELLELADRIEGDRPKLKYGDDIVLSFCGHGRPRIHDTGPSLFCNTANRRGIAVWKEFDFQQYRTELYWDLRKLKENRAAAVLSSSDPRTMDTTFPPASRSKRSSSDVPPGSLVVYTAITPSYEVLKSQPEAATRDVELVAFVGDESNHASAQWGFRPLDCSFDDPIRNAKIHKVLSHRYFPETTYSLWVDGSVVINFEIPVHRLVSKYLANCDLAVFRHSRRTCLYQEAQAALHQHLDDPGIIRDQIERYTKEGYPANASLSENCVILRRHTDAVEEFNEAWWEEIQQGSHRDQLSFNYVAWKCGLKIRFFPGSIEDRGGLFRKYPHASELPHRRLTRRRVQIASEVGHRLLSPVTLPMARALGHWELQRSRRRPAPWIRSHPISPASSWEPENLQAGPFNSVSKSKVRIAFGPERKYPSWDWVGYDTARELSKAYRTLVYSGADLSPPDCEVLFIIKERPAASFIADARARGARIVFCPVDFYESQEQLDGDAHFLRSCDMVLVHCERLMPLMRTHCPNTHFVEHHGRYSLEEMPGFKEDGFILWIGACQNLPPFLTWLETSSVKSEVKILTDLDYTWRKRGARRYSTLSLATGERTLAGCEVHRWSERAQWEMLQACKAAIDVKLPTDFNQYFKPPTKAQKYVSSGIPLAVNQGSYAEEYFRARGFRVAAPDDMDRLLSRAYWEETRRFAVDLRANISLEAVGRRYQELIESSL